MYQSSSFKPRGEPGSRPVPNMCSRLANHIPRICPPSLRQTWQKSRHVFEGDEWDIEGIAEPHEPCTLDGRRDVQTAYNQNNAPSCYAQHCKKLHEDSLPSAMSPVVQLGGMLLLTLNKGSWEVTKCHGNST